MSIVCSQLQLSSLSGQVVVRPMSVIAGLHDLSSLRCGVPRKLLPSYGDVDSGTVHFTFTGRKHRHHKGVAS